jgi:hypothetical protein
VTAVWAAVLVTVRALFLAFFLALFFVLFRVLFLVLLRVEGLVLVFAVELIGFPRSLVNQAVAGAKLLVCSNFPSPDTRNQYFVFNCYHSTCFNGSRSRAPLTKEI